MPTALSDWEPIAQQDHSEWEPVTSEPTQNAPAVFNQPDLGNGFYSEFGNPVLSQNIQPWMANRNVQAPDQPVENPTTLNQFIPALFERSPEQQDRDAQIAAGRKRFNNEDATQQAKQISDKWNAIISMSSESRPENIPMFQAQRDAELRSAGISPVDLTPAPNLPRLSEQDVKNLTGIKNDRFAKNLASAQGVTASLGESFMTPEGLAMFIPGGLGAKIGASFIPGMAGHAISQAAASAGHYSAGDIPSGDAAAVDALATGTMLAVPAFAARGKSIPNVYPELPSAESAAIRGGEPVNRLGVQVPGSQFLNPGILDLASKALEEAQGRSVLIPGQEPAIQTLRREFNPPQIEPAGLTPKEDYAGGQISFASPAEAEAIPSAGQNRFRNPETGQFEESSNWEPVSGPEAQSYRRPRPAPTEAEYRKAQARKAVEEGLYGRATEDVGSTELPYAKEGQFPAEGGPTGTFSNLQRERIQAGKENVRSNVRNNPPIGEPNALESQTTSSFFPLRDKSVEGQSQMPTEIEGRPTDEGGGNKYAAQKEVLSDPEAVSKLSPQEFVDELKKANKQPTQAGYELASTISEEQRSKLKEMDAQAAAETKAAIDKISKAKTPEEQSKAFAEAQNANAKKQYFNEAGRLYDAIQEVKKTGDAGAAASKFGVDRNRLEQIKPSAEQEAYYGNELAQREVNQVLNKTGTVKDILDQLSKGDDRWAGLASELLKMGDKEGLDVKIARRNPGESIEGVSPSSQAHSHYNANRDTINMVGLSGNIPVGEIIHEVGHGLTTRKIPQWLSRMAGEKNRGETYLKALEGAAKDPETPKPVQNLINTYRRAIDAHPDPRVKQMVGDAPGLHKEGLHYGLGDVDEFISEGLSSRKFQNWMDSIPGINGAKTLWQSFIQAVSKVLGLSTKGTTLLGDALKDIADVIAMKRPDSASSYDIKYAAERGKGVKRYGEKGAIEDKTVTGEKTFPKLVSTVGSSARQIPAKTLADVDKIFQPVTKEAPTLKERATQAIEAFRTGVSSKFRPLNKLAEDISKQYGLSRSKDIAGIFEQLRGSSGKAEADIYRFDKDVSDLIKGNEKNFNRYMFLQRTLDRLNQDAVDISRAQSGEEVKALNRRQVSNYTIPEVQGLLGDLESQIGPQNMARVRQAGDAYQVHMDRALKQQVDSGRMSQEVYDAIKAGNQFYAPFKVMKYIEETMKPEGSGRKVDTVADFTKAMEGIEDPNFKLGDMLGAARQNIALSRILAEKNRAMSEVANLAPFDTDGRFIQKLKPGQDAPKGMEPVNVLESGTKQHYAVNPDVAQAIQSFKGPANNIITRFMGKLFRFGATTANLPFQVSNLLADVPRQALVSRYGIKGVSDLIRYPIDFAESIFSSIAGDVFGKKNKLFLDFLDSGVAGTTIQEHLTPQALRSNPETFLTKPVNIAKTVLFTLPRFAEAIEQTSKILGVKRAMRMEDIKSGSDLANKVPEAITELRRFSGSPDFGRQGKWVEGYGLNLMYMFLNARVQGAVADIGRLTGRDGTATAAKTWLKLGAAVGIPTIYAYLLNNSPKYKADYDQRPEQEKRNYWLIPKDSYITGSNGEKIRDYWRIPKRESSQWIANFTESVLNFAEKRDPEAFWKWGVETMENVSPVNIQGGTAQQRMESVAASLNPVFKAPLEAATGRDLYRHRDIIPDAMNDPMKKASPKQQYTDYTPEVFKKLANNLGFLPEVFRSPLMLENMTKNITAGLITQFLPRKNIEGRGPLENMALAQRFQAVPYTDSTEFDEKMKKYERDSADDQLKRFRTVDTLIKSNPKDDLNTLASKLTPADRTDPKVVQRLVDVWVADQRGITSKERRILALPARERAMFIKDEMKGKTPEQQQAMIRDWASKRILTEAVAAEMTRE